MKYLIFFLSIIIFQGCSKSTDELNNDDHLFFKEIILKDGSINGWDQFDQADMQLILSGDTETYVFNTFENIQTFAEENVKWAVGKDIAVDSIPASDHRWILEVRDIDDNGFEEMVKFTFNPFLRWRQQGDSEATELEFYHKHWRILIRLHL